MQPGEPESPGNSSEPPKEPDKEPDQAGPESKEQAPKRLDAEPPVEPESTPPVKAAWSYNSSDSDENGALPASSPAAPVNWTASEYVDHNKGSSWFVMVIGVVAAISIVIYLVTKDLASPIAVFLVGLAFAVFGARPPQTLEYSVDGTGVHIGQRFYPYSQFKSFSILEEDAVRSILFMPIQRLGLPITIHYDQTDESKIVEVIGSHLPHEDRQVAAIDRLMSKIHF